MPTFTYSKKSRYWRPLCLNKLKAETSVPQNGAALPCSVCMYPLEVPPVLNCWCNSASRPQGVTRSITLTLGSSLGSETVGGTSLYNEVSKSWTGPSVINTQMVPADGSKTSTGTLRQKQDWTNASGNTFVAKNIHSYVPALTSHVQSCYWYALAGMSYVERVFHSTIVRAKAPQSFKPTPSSVNHYFMNLEVLKEHELIETKVVLDNNDPASIAMGINGPFSYKVRKNLVPQVAVKMHPVVGGDCVPVTCNQNCYPVSGYCHGPNRFYWLWPYSNGTIRGSFWYYQAKVHGYFWVIYQYNNAWLAWLFHSRLEMSSWSEYTFNKMWPYLDSTPDNTITWRNLEGFPHRYYGMDNPLKDANYPVTYHNEIPNYTGLGVHSNIPTNHGTILDQAYFGNYNDQFGIVGANPSGGMTGTARHPNWPGSIRSLDCFGGNEPSLYNVGEVPRNAYPLALYATDVLPCNQTGNVSMQKIADYRTAPNKALGTIKAGPSSFPSSATINL